MVKLRNAQYAEEEYNRFTYEADRWRLRSLLLESLCLVVFVLGLISSEWAFFICAGALIVTVMYCARRRRQCEYEASCIFQDVASWHAEETKALERADQ